MTENIKSTCRDLTPFVGSAAGSGIVDVWREAVTVRFGAIDKSDSLTLDTIFNYFQEAAISHAENLGVGREAMAKTGQVWILSRMSVIVNKRPGYCETVAVRSWPRGWDKLFAIRDYDIRDENDTACVSARSAWLIVDIEKRRPLRPQAVMGGLPGNEGLEALRPEDSGASGLPERSSLHKCAERKALYTDIDFNGHVNNVRYIQWIEDTLEPGLLEKSGKMRFDINYLNEVLEGETVELFSVPIYNEEGPENASADYAFAFEGRKKENGQTAFRAELRLWEK
ncbi:MAG: thioesterase [Treponema sp.]|nr:thioesterase [Treponema sp.]